MNSKGTTPAPAGVVFLPSPAFLLPDYVGLHDPAAELRRACVQVLSDALDDQVDAVVVVCVQGHAPASRADPLGARVAAHLLAEAGWVGPTTQVRVPIAATPEQVRDAASALAAALAPRSTGAGQRKPLVVVAADGTATRTQAAPGSFDPRAEGFDGELRAALAAASQSRLLALDPGLGAQLWASGLAAYQLVAAALEHAAFDGALIWTGEPYGVAYTLARWT